MVYIAGLVVIILFLLIIIHTKKLLYEAEEIEKKVIKGKSKTIFVIIQSGLYGKYCR
jgi:hypothetical protein